jgi:hypothetical protein
MADDVQVFLSYARPDEDKVVMLYDKLVDAGYKPWMDIKDILPGENWRLAIQRAIRNSDFFLACLSPHSVGRRGVIQSELKDALDMWREQLESDIYLIPVRLEDCETPDSLRDLQWVNWFEEDGWEKLGAALRAGIRQRLDVVKPGEPVPLEPERARGRVLVPEDERPAKYRGLIILVGTGRPGEPPMRQAAWKTIEHHLSSADEPGLETCWLIASKGEKGSVPIAQQYKAACEDREVTAYVRAVDAFDLQAAYDVVQRIYEEEVPRAGLTEQEVICDFTGGTKLMSAGMILACDDRRPMQYMYGRKTGIASVPTRVPFTRRG